MNCGLRLVTDELIVAFHASSVMATMSDDDKDNLSENEAFALYCDWYDANIFKGK